MPNYQYKCEQCGRVIERYYSIAERAVRVKCVCGAFASRDYTCVHVIPDMESFVSHDMDKEPVRIESKADLRQKCADRGLTVTGVKDKLWYQRKRKQKLYVEMSAP